MDVYLVPVGHDRHELYCEVPEPVESAEEDAQAEASRGFLRRMRDRFREMLAEAERERRHSHAGRTDSSWAGRVKTRMLRWVAESIAEQRLLWHLRNETEACLFYPDDLDEPRAIEVLQAQLGRDFDKHRTWMIIDGVGFIGSGFLMLIPGPNLIAYYFAFRLVGHYFSMRGAKQGLRFIKWHAEPSPPLTELRRAMALEPEMRVRSVREIASRLRLEHLARFFERTAVPTS
jgi:hypothetical protein